MATTFTFDRHSCYGDAEMLSNLDPNGEYTDEQYDLLREIYSKKVAAIVAEYDPTLTWFPYISEIYGVVGETESDPVDFREWWKSGADGKFETAWLDACEEVENLGEDKKK